MSPAWGSPAGSEEERFLVGANLPWITYGCDFGANAWQPDGGVGAPGRAERLEGIFARLSAGGLHAVRWFLFCDGRAGIEWDARGRPRALDARIFRDLDTALAAAGRHRLSLILVLFDFTLCSRRRRVDEVQLGGRRGLVAAPVARDMLLQRVVRPVLASYGADATIAAWDLFNEPEWATWGYGGLNPFRSVRPACMRRFLRDLEHLVHAETRHAVTVGLARPGGARLLRGLRVDVHQLHWYDRRSRGVPHLTRGFEGKPVMLGEFPTRGSRLSVAQILDAARERGYAAAFGWSALAADRHSQLEALEELLRARRQP